MSYEYEFKEYIREEILSNINHMNILDDALEELDLVYKQAAKADEYEAKAKAFDDYHRIISKHIEQQYSHNKHDMVKRFVKIHDEYESGEPNAKK